MALYGTTDSDESKPKWLRTGTKYTPEDVYASASGWVVEAGSPATGNANPNAKPEVLVAIRGLAGRIGAADITTIEFVTTSFSYAAGGTLSVLVRFNEEANFCVGERVCQGCALYTGQAPRARNNGVQQTGLREAWQVVPYVEDKGRR